MAWFTRLFCSHEWKSLETQPTGYVTVGPLGGLPKVEISRRRACRKCGLQDTEIGVISKDKEVFFLGIRSDDHGWPLDPVKGERMPSIVKRDYVE